MGRYVVICSDPENLLTVRGIAGDENASMRLAEERDNGPNIIIDFGANPDRVFTVTECALCE